MRAQRRAQAIAVTAAVLVALTACGRSAPIDGTEGPTAAATASETSSPSRPTRPAPTTASPTTEAPTTHAPPSSTPPPTAAPTTTPAPPAPTPPATTTPAPPPPPTAEPPAPPSTTVPAAWAGKDWEVLPGVGAKVALTFDGGASNTGVDSIIRTLKDQGVPATFFVTGQFARAYPDSVRAMSDAGFAVGNHSDTHPYFSSSTNVKIHAELTAAEASISALTGRTTMPLFRFPYGDRTDLDIKVVNSEGYVPIRWTVDSLGWKGRENGARTSDTVCRRVLETARNGQIVLMHVGAHPDDGSTLDADALPCIINGLRASGYGFVSLRDVVR